VSKIIAYFISQEDLIKRALTDSRSGGQLRFVRRIRVYGNPEDAGRLEKLYSDLLKQVDALELVFDMEFSMLDAKLEWGVSEQNPLTRQEALRYQELLQANLRKLAAYQVWLEWLADVGDIPVTESLPFNVPPSSRRPWARMVEELKLVFS
jgi:hypothetical protein